MSMPLQKIILLTLLFSVTFLKGFGQNKLEVFADSLAKAGQNKAALKEYLRCIYYDDGSLSQDIYVKTAHLFYIIEDVPKCLEYLDIHFYKNFDNKTEKNNVFIQKAQIFIKEDKINEALSHIYQIQPTNPIESDNKFFYLLVANLMLKNETESIKALEKLSYINVSDVAFLKNDIQSIVKLSKKKSNKAIFQSSLIPGLGQAVHGDVKDGLKSFVLVTTLGVLFVNVSLAYTFSDALLSVGPWLTRYYFGGIVNASQQAKQKNKLDYNDRLFELVAKIYSLKSKHNR